MDIRIVKISVFSLALMVIVTTNIFAIRQPLFSFVPGRLFTRPISMKTLSTNEDMSHYDRVLKMPAKYEIESQAVIGDSDMRVAVFNITVTGEFTRKNIKEFLFDAYKKISKKSFFDRYNGYIEIYAFDQEAKLLDDAWLGKLEKQPTTLVPVISMSKTVSNVTAL